MRWPAHMGKRAEHGFGSAHKAACRMHRSALLMECKHSCRRRGVAHVDEVECTLCLKLLYEPVTVSCGHTFCRPCFLRAQDHCSRCPMCRTVLHVGRDLPVSITLKNILEKSFPQEYAERCAEEAADAGSAANAAEAAVPLFVMSCLMPGELLQCRSCFGQCLTTSEISHLAFVMDIRMLHILPVK